MPMRINALYAERPGHHGGRAVVSELAREVALRLLPQTPNPEWAWTRHGALRTPA